MSTDITELSSKFKVKKRLNEVLKLEEPPDKVLIVLLDCSGSMFDIYNSGKTKLDAVWNALQNELSPRMAGWGYGIILFSDTAEWAVQPTVNINKLKIMTQPRIRGGTSIKLGLASCWDWIKQYKANSRIILMSDGVPTDAPPDLILALAEQNKTIPIDTVGVGNHTVPGSYDPLFLQTLSRITGGIYCEIATVKELALTVKQLSPEERPLLGRVS